MVESRPVSAWSVNPQAPLHPERARAGLELFTQDPCVGVWSLTRDLQLSFLNPAAAKLLLGTAPEDVVNQPLADLVPERVVEGVRALVLATLDDGARPTCRAFWGARRLRSAFQPMALDLPGDVLIVTRPDPIGFTPNREDDGSLHEATYAFLGALSVLSPREVEVLGYFGEGMRRDAIAKRLFRSPKTIDAHQSSLRQKLNVRHRADLMRIAREAGLTPDIADRVRVAPVTAAAFGGIEPGPGDQAEGFAVASALPPSVETAVRLRHAHPTP